MFAIALWDKQEQVLTLARDRMGDKPLYWGWCGDTLLSGSELKALKAHPAFKADIDRNALALFLRHNYIPAPHCIYQGIEKLRAGYFVQIKQGQQRQDVVPKPYWSLKTVVEAGLANPFNGSDAQAIDLLEQQFSASIGLQMLDEQGGRSACGTLISRNFKVIQFLGVL